MITELLLNIELLSIVHGYLLVRLHLCMHDCNVWPWPLIFRCHLSDLKSSSSNSEVEVRYQQSRRYIELHERLQEERGNLARRRDELRASGESLEHSVMEVKRSALWQLAEACRTFTPASYELEICIFCSWLLGMALVNITN